VQHVYTENSAFASMRTQAPSVDKSKIATAYYYVQTMLIIICPKNIPLHFCTCTCTHTDLSNTIGRFKTSQYHPTSARISWKKGEKTITGYRVRVEGPDSTQVFPISDCGTSICISDLRSSTQYTYKVSAVTVAGTTPQRGETSMP
jgi:hypothetical protein